MFKAFADNEYFLEYEKRTAFKATQIIKIALGQYCYEHSMMMKSCV
jgi:hypothetical protein